MGIRSKILLAFLLCFGLVGWASLVLLKQRMNAEFSDLERADLHDSMGRVLKIMDASVSSLRSQTRDWAEWTDMYDYVRAPHARQAWASSNLDAQALDTADLSFVDILDARAGYVRAVRSAGVGSAEQLPLDQRQALAARLALGDAPLCGLQSFSARFALVCAARVSRSDRSGGYVGLVVMGRFLDGRRVAQWQEQSGFGLWLNAAGDIPPAVQWLRGALPANGISGQDYALHVFSELNTMYLPLQSLDGQPLATLEVRIPRELFARTQALQTRLAWQFGVSALVIAVLLATAVHWLLVRRLRDLTRQLQELAEAGAWSRKVVVPGRDELRVLATEVNFMLEMIDDQVRDLTAQSMTDTLTGLANRRAFDMRLALEFGRARRHTQPLSLLVVDVDYFKCYNDHYGHPAGDAALRTVAEVLATACGRTIDLAARIGGEEFALLLPNTPLEGAVDIAHRLQRLLAQRAIEHEASEVAPHLTVSIGVAAIGMLDDSAHALVARADRALYVAKSQGRNRHHCDVPAES
ncbi:diguanylate cyclase [Curvibacter sp. APW13]|uniref:GGDEF domain-containing protein n=1 Tax=Curvibacter sp. APW13 TaxID=3077236 RepID=UPI0028DD9987|nr:diguanylate cyclase [Curvibacter sp. APW13]MDT8990074.1 diguanylate cyclase [Curvibacter sp. APW13]